VQLLFITINCLDGEEIDRVKCSFALFKVWNAAWFFDMVISATDAAIALCLRGSGGKGCVERKILMVETGIALLLRRQQGYAAIHDYYLAFLAGRILRLHF